MTCCPSIYHLLYLSFGIRRLSDCCFCAAAILISASVSDPFPLLSSLSLFFLFFTQLPFGEGLFHFYPQDTSKRRSKRSARNRQRLQKDNRVSMHAEMHSKRSTVRGAQWVSCMHVPGTARLPIHFA